MNPSNRMRMRMSLVKAAAAIALVPGMAWAVDAPVKAAAPAVASNPLGMLWGLLFLLALVGAGWWLVRRAGGLQIQGGRGMRVVAALSVGAREKVVLVEIAGEQYLLGVAPGRVNLLHRFEQPIMPTAAGGDDFASKIRQVMQQGLNR